MKNAIHYQHTPSKIRYLIRRAETNDKTFTFDKFLMDTGIPRLVMSAYIDGTQIPNYNCASLISKYFNVSPDWLLRSEPELQIALINGEEELDEKKIDDILDYSIKVFKTYE